MPIDVNPITHKKLVLVKQIYQNAVIQSTSHHSSVSRIMAVIGFDLAVETALKVLVRALDVQKVPEENFHSLIQQTDSLLSKANLEKVPDKVNILHIHSIRNDAQHQAKYPNESDVSDCRTYCRDFLSKFILSNWGLQFDSVSLVDTLQHEEIRIRLHDAEASLENSEYQEAAQKAAIGLHITLEKVKPSIVGSIPFFITGIAVESPFEREYSHDGRDILQTLMRMQNISLFSFLGLDYAQYIRLTQIVGYIHQTGDGEYHFSVEKADIHLKDAEFVVSYCIGAVLEIENRVGDLLHPFSVNSGEIAQ